MVRVSRPWLRRVGEYAGPGPQRIVRRRRAQSGQQQDPFEKEQAAAEEDDSAEETDELADGSEAASPSADDSEEGEGDPPAQPSDDPHLEVPDEVEQRRQQEKTRQEHSQLNRAEAPQAFSLEGKYLRGLAFHFARMVSKVAEDYADMPQQGDDEWDLEELRMRRFTGRLVSQCRMTREKRKVAVVLDTSPSCEQQARLFASVAQVAEALGDCELYDAPNFVIGARKLQDRWETLPEAEREWSFQRRVVLAFGDFDGIDRICAASRVRENRIYWFCCEERAPVLESLRQSFLKNYKGFYMPAATLAQLMKAMRKVR